MLQPASTGMSPSHFVTRTVGFFNYAWLFSTDQIIHCQRLVPSRAARTKARASAQPASRMLSSDMHGLA